MIYRSKTNNKLRVLLGLFGMISLLWLCPSITRTIALSPARRYKSAPATTQASLIKTNGKIAFSSDRNGFLDIYLMNSDGADQRQLTFGGVNPADGFRRTYASNPVWSPDGTKIAFISIKDNDWTGIYVMNTDGTNRLRLTSSQANDDSPKWSQDGSKIAFKRSYDAFGTDGDVYTMDADGGRQTPVTSG